MKTELKDLCFVGEKVN